MDKPSALTIPVGTRPLRRGFTTGSCAALAAQAATHLLLTGQAVSEASLLTPAGEPFRAAILHPERAADWAACAVRKDAGDDPDVTDGVLVRATVSRLPEPGITIDGGEGVGRVTRPGLDPPVGAAAINRVPRQMIGREVQRVCDHCGYRGGVSVVISIPGGEALAAATFNPRLGIVGGLSVIGTSGLVEPMSVRALIDAVAVELRLHRAEGARGVVLVPGNYGATLVASFPALAGWPVVKCGNSLGEALDRAVALEFAAVIVAGHLGKMIKLSGGIMETHSRTADCRMELLALFTALAGAETAVTTAVLDGATVDDGLARIQRHGLLDAVLARMLPRIDMYLGRRSRDRCHTGAVVFTNRLGLLGVTAGARAAMAAMENANG
ncbi:MAG: cobalt-precorrin-5B (C(1))-methyltransferase CbiD [Planctomycetes bacterium]|nr:cobalt-precorrin-5B (C(1))-methyltransferase CbiD [Planctomycetota bacterium]